MLPSFKEGPFNLSCVRQKVGTDHLNLIKFSQREIGCSFGKAPFISGLLSIFQDFLLRD